MDSAKAWVPRPRLPVLDVPIDVMTGDQLRLRLRSFLAEPWDGRCRQIATVNPEYVMAATRHAAFGDGIRAADLITADGIGVLIAARLLEPASSQDLHRVTGVEITEWLAADSDQFAAPLFLLGAKPGVAEKAADALKRRFPHARIAGWWSDGTPNIADDAETLRRVKLTQARAVLVAYGAPGQVIWIMRNQAALADAGVRVAVGIGGTLDFLSGTAPRAPRAVQQLGLEWLYRLVREPWRWRRQIVLPVFAIRVLLQWLRQRGNRAGRIARLK